MNTKKNTLISPDHPLVAQYRSLFTAQVDKPEFKTINFLIAPEIVDSLEVMMAQEVLLAAEHFPHLIEKLLFSFEFKFEQVAGSKLHLQELDWKNNPAYYRWFSKMREGMPIIFFFINDEDARFYTIAGDLLAEGKNLEVQQDEGDKYATIGFEAEQAQLIADRVWTGCWLFMHYCHGTPCDAKPYVDALISEYEMPFTLADLEKEFENDLKQGTRFRVQRKEQR